MRRAHRNYGCLLTFGTWVGAIIISIFLCNKQTSVQAISIKPADFDRLIMPCYLGGGSSSGMYGGGGGGGGLSQPSSSLSQAGPPSAGAYLPGGGGQPLGRTNGANMNGMNGLNLGSNQGPSSYNSQPPSYFGPADNNGGGRMNQAREGLSNLGQQVPRGQTIDNFIALLSKIEAANPRLANNPDQLIRMLLGRFRMDNYYYDVRSRTPISEQDHRNTIIPAILNPMGLQQQQGLQTQAYLLSSDSFPEQLLDHDEKCSMYFMLSHFIEKGTPLSQPLANIPVTQLTGPLGGQRPPVLQAAGTGYPAQSANQAFSGGAQGPRYSGPSPSFGSPATSNMNSFVAGNTPDTSGFGGGGGGRDNPYGVNSLQPNSQFNQNYNNLRNAGPYAGTGQSNTKQYQTPFVDGGARGMMGRAGGDERTATEYGVVTVANQENAALVLNRVLMGILAAATPPQSIRQLSAVIYPTQFISNTPKIDEEIDPLYAVTLADLWAISAIPKAGKAGQQVLGDNGHWNNTMCPTAFHLDRASSIRFTTAELIGGLDGFSLGIFRRRLISMRKNIRLSELLRMYYSKTGFMPQFSEVGVCNRINALNTQLDDLYRQAENYLRLYQLNLPTSDSEIATSINRLSSFKEAIRQVASQYSPPEVCQESSYGGGGGGDSVYPSNQQDQCEIAKADVVTVLDSSPQANDAFMNLVVAKLAQKLGLSRQGNSLSVLTNQQDTSGYAGAYSFNAIVRNSTNTAEIGCALVHDTTSSYQGGQITDPTRLVEMFERALVNLDSEYLVRQTVGGSGSSSGDSSLLSYSSNKHSSYVSSLFQSSDYSLLAGGAAGGPKNTGGAKAIIWFSYGPQVRPATIASGPTNWNGPSYSSDQNQYKFFEAKKYLRENFRGASILAVATSRDDVKSFVYDETRDIFTDIPAGSSSSSLLSSDYYSPSSSSVSSANDPALSGAADQLVGKLLQRMCDIPTLFQYPMCFRAPSENVMSAGYISPGRKQYWMMSPKTFFASRTVRMAFKVEGGRLKVCFGRMPKPDESAMRSGQDSYTGVISFGGAPPSSAGGQGSFNAPMQSNQISQQASSNGNNYYTGLKNGICKDVSPGQEIDFIVDDPCYDKPIAECEPFYFVIRETSNPGEGDPNYMCKDEGCKRFDQARFTMAHTGVACSSAFKGVKANWLLFVISIFVGLKVTSSGGGGGSRLLSGSVNLNRMLKSYHVMVAMLAASFCLLLLWVPEQVQAQQAGVHDFGQGRYGERRGNFTPSEILAIILLIMTILGGLALAIGLCYYVTKRNNTRGMQRVEQDVY